MPTLMEKKDGLYYVRHYYQQHSTWQIDSDGVSFLEKHGVHPGEQFSTTLFMELWGKGMVYTGTRRPVQRVGEGGTRSPDDVVLHDRACALLRALHQGKTEEACTFLAPPLQKARERLGAKFPRPEKWKIVSFDSMPWQGEATRRGKVVVDAEFDRDSSVDDSFFEQDWFQIKGVWYWHWLPSR
jgi:hypothetical protein